MKEKDALQELSNIDNELESVRKLIEDVSSKHISVYLANSLFSEADRAYNDLICDKLDEIGIHDYYAPQRNAAINDKSKSADSIAIFDGDTEKLRNADVLIAVLDSQDLGVASEVGWVAGWNELADRYDGTKLILGLYTDSRDAYKTMSSNKNDAIVKAGVGESQYSYINLYTIGACKKWGDVFSSVDDLIAAVKKVFM